MNERGIQKRLYWNIGHGRAYAMVNVHVFCNESDFLTVTKNGYVDEYEIKISRSDFLRDFGKSRHISYKDPSQYPESRFPNRFWFVVPDGLMSIDETPDYAGLIYCHDNGATPVVKPAPMLHRNKDGEFVTEKLLVSAYHRFWSKVLYEA